MKKQVKELIYKTLIRWGWIENNKIPQSVIEMAEIEMQSLQNVLNAFNLTPVIDDNNNLVRFYKNSYFVRNCGNLKPENALYTIPCKDNYAIETLSYFAYFGIREKNGVVFRNVHEIIPAPVVTTDFEGLRHSTLSELGSAGVNRYINKQYESEPVIPTGHYKTDFGWSHPKLDSHIKNKPPFKPGCE